MPEPANGITAEVIRNIMPPYHLSPDLLEATLAALPAPPPDASPAWRLARLTRVIEEITAPKPADAEQARIASDILIVRELARALALSAHAAGQTTEQKCNLARAANALLKTAISLDRSLARHQQQPVAFFGTVVQEEVDLAALDATWHPQPAPPDAAPLPPAAPTPLPTGRTTAEPVTPPADHPEPATTPEQDPDTTPEWSFTKLDEGPGWSREVLRHRSSQPGGNGSTP
jgi:hypothetical protein